MKSNIDIKYTPEESAKVADILSKHQDGLKTLNTPIRAYDERTIMQEAERNQKAFNTYMPPRKSDPDFDWMADTVRPITRNKIIAIATKMTAMVIYPSFRAQNSNDMQDKDTAEVMRLISRWIIENSSYEMDYARTVINALTDPIAYIETGFFETIRNKRYRDENGEIKTKEVIDEIMSGILFKTLKVNEILFQDITLAPSQIQEQGWLIKRKITSLGNAKQRYGQNKNWKYVKGGTMVEFDSQSASFYEEDTKHLKKDEVIIMTYFNRLECEEITLVSGVLMTSHEEPMTREDGLYPYATLVFEEIQSMFTGKSAVNKIAPDQNLIDSLYNMIFDAGAIALIPPMISYGETRFDAPVMIPGQVTHADEEGKVEVLSGNSNIQAGLSLTQNIEGSMSESTQSSRASGVADSKEMTAVEYAGLEQNSMQALGMFGKQLSHLVKQLGRLMQGDIIQYLTMPDIEGLLGDGQKVNYKSLLANGNLQGDGPSDMNQVRFTDQFYGGEEVDEFEVSMRLLEEEGYKSDVKIKLVDPILFRKQKFTVFISEEELTKENKRMEKALNLEAYDRAINNPLLDQNEITKHFLLENYVPGDEDKYMAKSNGVPRQEVDQPVDGNLPQQMTGGGSLKSLLANPQ
jgi:hypothetical protein